MKYVYRGQNADSPSTSKIKIENIIIVILIVALLVSIATRFIGGKTFNTEDVKIHIKNMLNAEIKNAITQAESLGRSGASGTTNTISRVRQHVYALDNLNSLSILLMGQSARVFPQQYIDTAMASIDDFLVQLQKGQSVNEALLKLTDNLSRLEDQLRLMQ